MNDHVAENLPFVLSGEASRADTLHAAGHLRDCVDCQQELVAALVSHASLISARRHAPDIVIGHRDQKGASLPVPAMSELFDATHAEAIGRRRRGHRRAALAVAAAALIGAIASLITAELTGPASTSTAGRVVALRAFDTGTRAARATLGANTVRIDASALPELDASHFYEVWLTDPARTRLQAIGSIGAGNRAAMAVPPNVLNQYSAIEVSIQGVDQTGYSGTSVLRGGYT